MVESLTNFCMVIHVCRHFPFLGLYLLFWMSQGRNLKDQVKAIWYSDLLSSFFFLYNSTPSCFVFLVKKYLIHYHSFHLIFMLVLKFLTLINHVKHELWCVHSTPLFLRCLNSLGRVWWEPCMGTTRGLRPPTSRNFLDIMWLEMVICAVIHFQFYSKCASYNCVKWEFAL